MSLAVLEAAKFAKMLAAHRLTTNDLGPNSDLFIGTSARDTFNGGAGNDTVSYSTSTAGINLTLTQNSSPVGGFAAGDTLLGIENAIGTNFRDVLSGDDRANVLVGLGGDDSIYGNGGADRLYGDSGNDTVANFGLSGVHTYLDGGAGNDTIVYTTSGGTAEITTGTENDLVKVRISDSQDFRVVITDFQPYWENVFGVVTEAESFRGDRISLLFNESFDASLDALSTYQQIISGDDLILHFQNGAVNGDLVFQDIGQWLDLNVNNGFSFYLNVGNYTEYLAV